MKAQAEPFVAVEHLFRRQASAIVAHLARVLGPARLDLAEESVQEAMLRALRTWPFEGMPPNPAAWLFRVAQNCAIDAVRRERRLAGSDALPDIPAAPPGPPQIDEQLQDDELRMIFMCCHPELPHDSRVALSLKIAGGFGVREIARAFLSDEATVAQRLVRAKRQIRAEGYTLELPAGPDLQRRLRAVLEVLYFIFNEGYGAHAGEDLVRHELCGEALRLGRLIAASSLSSPAVHALVALMALQAARLPARIDEAGDLVPFEQQDRSRWDQRLIALGFHHFDRAIAGEDVTEYHVQAAIAATYARAALTGEVKWDVILGLYDQLAAVAPSPVVSLNRSVAVAKVHGPAAGLAATEPLLGDAKLKHYHLLLAVRGRLLRDLGQNAEAAKCFEAALACHCSEPERRFLERRLEEAKRSSET